MPATASASTPGRSAAAITVRTPDHAAILAAASLDAMPPLPPTRAGPAGHRLEALVDLDDLLDERGRRVEAGIGGEQPRRVGEQHQQVGADEVGDEGGDAVVVAEADLVVGDGVVLVDDRAPRPARAAAASVPRACRYWRRSTKSSGASSTWPATSPWRPSASS